MAIARRRKQVDIDDVCTRNSYACKRDNCFGHAVPGRISLLKEDGSIWQVVCYKKTCNNCGQTVYRTYNGKATPLLWRYDTRGFARFNPEDFDIPEEICKNPVFCKDGSPVFDENGNHVYGFSKTKKVELVKKLLSLVDWTKGKDQGFKLDAVMKASPMDIF